MCSVIILFDLLLNFPSLSGTPGLSLSAGPAALIWVGSSQRQRRICLRLAFGVWPVQLCFPASHREKARKAEEVPASFVCDFKPPSPPFPKKKQASLSLNLLSVFSYKYFLYSHQCITAAVMSGEASVALVNGFYKLQIQGRFYGGGWNDALKGS